VRVELTPFSPEEHDVIVHDIAAFWQHHASLANRDETITSEQAENTLLEWQGKGHTLFSIWACGKQAGFLHMQRIGPIVMQLEDIFVQPALRRLGRPPGYSIFTGGVVKVRGGAEPSHEKKGF